MPFLASPLSIVLDPIALYLIIYVQRLKLFKFDIPFFAVILIGVLSIFTAVFGGHGNIWVASYGKRIMFIHIPFMYMVAIVLKKKDLIQMGKVLFYISLPTTKLMVLQFHSPQTGRRRW